MRKLILIAILVMSFGAVPAWASVLSGALLPVGNVLQPSTTNAILKPSSTPFDCSTNTSQCTNIAMMLGPNGSSPFYKEQTVGQLPSTAAQILAQPSAQIAVQTRLGVQQLSATSPETLAQTFRPADVGYLQIQSNILDKPNVTAYSLVAQGTDSLGNPILVAGNSSLNVYLPQFDMTSVAAGVSAWMTEYGNGSSQVSGQ